MGRKIFLLLVVGALGYAFFTVPIRGRTAWRHAVQLVNSEVVKAEGKLKAAPEFQKAAADAKQKPGENGKGGKVADKANGKAQDKLTGKDQKALEDLINEKIKK